MDFDIEYVDNVCVCHKVYEYNNYRYNSQGQKVSVDKYEFQVGCEYDFIYNPPTPAAARGDEPPDDYFMIFAHDFDPSDPRAVAIYVDCYGFNTHFKKTDFIVVKK